MKSFEFESFDGGRLTLNRAFVDVFDSHGMLTFDALMNHSGGSVAKNLLRERTTTRFELTAHEADASPEGPTCCASRVRSRSERTPFAFYIKRHSPPPMKEYLKPLLRLTWPILGARNEWNALLRFHAAGIATMVPGALGESRGHSFLVTQAIEGCDKLSHWMDAHLVQPRVEDLRTARGLIAEIATIARTMHGEGMHHQDFYLTHLLAPKDDVRAGLYVIDLGRVRRHAQLSRRWIVKDLAQLNYSATHATPADRLRFMTAYLGRPVDAADRPLIRRVLRKSSAIARHSRKNRL